jgi:tRNA dimethylallyltransferase
VCLLGPTASGKSALALALATRFDAEIVSADSRQVYRGLDVGTAKPTAAERRQVPHHCIDVADPHETYDAARFRAAAAAAIADIHARGRTALVVGGTGLYLRALLRGLCPAPAAVPALRAVLRAMIARRGTDVAHRALAAVDPAAAARIGARDAVRIVRALEVGLATGVPLSRWQATHRFAERPYRTLVVGLARAPEELAARIAARADAMLAAGFLDEVRALVGHGIASDAPAWRAVGYAEMRAWAEGRSDRERALAATIAATRRFAKRQRTWFRREPDVVWRHPEDDRAAIVDEVEAFLAAGATAIGA